MTPRWIAAALAGGLMVFGAASPRAQVSTAEAMFRETLAKERAEGALQDAVFGYERIIAEFPADRQAAGKAMFQLALIYEKLGDPRATVLLNRLVRDYSSVEPVAGRAKARLHARQAEPPAPFASVSLDENYELGSPDGRLVVYHRSGDEWGQLYVKDLVAVKERLLIDAPGSSVSNFAWSPDSKKLAYNFGSADNLGQRDPHRRRCHRRVQVRRHDGLSHGMDGHRRHPVLPPELQGWDRRLVARGGRRRRAAPGSGRSFRRGHIVCRHDARR